MAAPTGYPSWCYNAAQNTSLIVNTVAQFTALGGAGTWTTTPFAGTSSIPADAGLTDTDIRLQQILIENRLSNNLLAALANITDDLLAWRQDIIANDSGLTT